MRSIISIEELKSLVGQEIGVTDWVLVLQERVNLFAEATGDQQWIHIDVERSRRESPYGGTIAHGFLTLSLLPMLMESVISMPTSKMGVNYGLNKVRFPATLPVGSKVRGRIVVMEVEDIAGGVQITWKVTVELESADKPVCVAELLTRQYW